MQKDVIVKNQAALKNIANATKQDLDVESIVSVKIARILKMFSKVLENRNKRNQWIYKMEKNKKIHKNEMAVLSPLVNDFINVYIILLNILNRFV